MSGTRVVFEKWEGLGNDFVLVEVPAETWSDEQVRAVCDRRRGVGADGVLFVTRGAPPGDAPRGKDWRTPPRGELPRMVVRNADGSRPEMCGNGIRCVAGWLASHGATSGAEAARGLDPAAAEGIAGTITIATDAGPKRCEVTGGEGLFEVSVAMGPARIEGQLAVEVDGRAHVFTRGDVGNPHAITFEPYDQGEIDRVGPRVATSPRDGTNVEFCRLVRGGDGGDPSRKRPADAAPERWADVPLERADAAPERWADAAPERLVDVPRVDVVVWERGVGRTLACGTGACAVASAACAAGYFAYGAPVRVRLPGGDLFIAVEAGTWAATMRGPARRVFKGELVTP